MNKIFLLGLLLLITLGLLVGLYFFVSFSGGVKGVWYDLTDSTFDPYAAMVVDKRDSARNHIISEFNFIDTFPASTKYGVHNTDSCTRNDYSYKRPISVSSSLYTCSYISQRYYGLDGEYQSTVQSLVDYFRLNDKELNIQGQQIDQLFASKDWLSDEPTVQKIIKSHNFENPNDQVSDIYEVLSMLETKKDTSILSTTNGYYITFNFIDEGVKPSGSYKSRLYEQSDEPDRRDQYVSQIIENHDYGVVITIKKDYYKK